MREQGKDQCLGKEEIQRQGNRERKGKASAVYEQTNERPLMESPFAPQENEPIERGHEVSKLLFVLPDPKGLLAMNNHA